MKRIYIICLGSQGKIFIQNFESGMWMNPIFSILCQMSVTCDYFSIPVMHITL